ncbi:vacuolar amino acid transporter 1 [Olea europaea subsp. europaea]|uniref:Vacuolar amino acid transporter 1 n=1 Tax=Olea europaea subsp. europaea TaxID=158383 RepID=A0A8S0SX53_OLEEU|nr:vacuolar amino acid transporter 1 [Olea europaea subsp. europaea]
MKNSVSDQSFYVESEGDDEEKEDNKGEDDADGNDSDSSNYSNDDDNYNQREQSKFNSQWPQSYRQSIDLYSSVPSPSLNFLGTPSLSRLSSSFLSSSLTRRHTPEILPTLSKPLIPAIDDDKARDRHTSHLPIPPTPTRKPSIRKTSIYEKTSKVSHELPISRQSSYGQAVINGMNVLCGVGILSTPYAVKEGGWAGLSILLIFSVLSFYTGILLRYCLDSEPGLETYPDIGQAAFGTVGRVAISIILYVELYACCVEYIILESDNLSSLFPNAHLNFGVFDLNSRHLFALMATLAVLPTVMLRDLSVLSYISAGGVLASLLVVACLFWVGLVDQVGFQAKGTTLNLSTLPVAIGLYGYCYSGHAVFPNIYTSMEKRSLYPAVLLASFGICTMLYAGVAGMGYTMFGETVQSQFTLNMPKDLVASKIALWTTVCKENIFLQNTYALTISPVAMSLEELIPSNHAKSRLYAILIRTALVISTLIVGLIIPFFGLLMALIGSLLTMLVTLILPCACYLSILRGKISFFQRSMCTLVITIGVISSAFGTFSAMSKIIQNLS